MSDRDTARARWESAAEDLQWDTAWRTCYINDRPKGRWFVGGELNVCVNCVDRHLPQLADKIAIHWEGEPADRRTITYDELQAEISSFAEVLRGLSVRPDDRVVLYMGWIPEAVVAMLACARIGAVHELLPSALPADALADRLSDVKPKVLVTQDGAWRHGVILPLKSHADESLAAVASIEHTVVVRRTGVDIAWYEGDHWYHELLAGVSERSHSPPEAFPADHPLFAIHLANRRGRPAAIVHGSGGFLAAAATLHRSGLTLSGNDVFWCAVDIGWIAGQAHGVYGPLACGATTVMYEGTLDTPTHARAWEIIARYGVNALLTSPSVVRNLRWWVDSPPPTQRLDSLRLIVTGGEPIEPEVRDWLVNNVGGRRAIVADAWGESELGGIVTVTPSPQGEGSLPDPGLDVIDPSGNSVAVEKIGELVLRHPWPGTFLSIETDEGPAGDEHLKRFPGDVFATGDKARRESDGSLSILGRSESVVKISGQLVSLTEVTQVLLEHPFVQAADVIEQPDPRSGHTLVACVALEPDTAPTEDVARDIRTHVHDTLGGLAAPRKVVFVESFPPDVPIELLRQALRALCAANPAEIVRLSTAQLRSAASATQAP